MSQIVGPPPLQPGPSPTPPAAARRPWYRRPALVIPVALAVAAAVAAALFLALRPTTITATGTVIDRLTGQPVSSATLRANGTTARTNAHGAFRLPGLPPSARMSVQARYYATTQVRATTKPMKMRLAPVPVPVAVTSALTGGPLPAALVTPNGDRVQARADGTATLYRVGPGEAVTVTAAGYLPGHAAVGADHRVKAALAPTQPTLGAQLRKWDRTRHYQAIIDWILRPATGSTFMGTSPHAWARDNRQMAGDPQTAYIGGGYTADGTGATIQIAWPGARWDPAGIASTLPGPPVHPVTLAGRQAWHNGPDSHHVFTAVWSYGPALITVTGTNGQHQVDAVMTGIIRAMTGTGQGT
jgi:Carboxypeptidase regulatory-like domain